MRPSLRRWLAGAVTGTLVAAGAVAGVAAPAAAATSDVSAGSLRWGMDADYLAVFATRGATAPASWTDGDTVAEFPVAATSSTYDRSTGKGTIGFSGAARAGYFAGPPLPGTADGNYFSLANPRIVIEGTSGTLVAGTVAGSSHSLDPALPTHAGSDVTIATLDLSAGAAATPTSVTWTSVPVAITAEGAAYFAKYTSADAATPTVRAAGSALAPLTFSITTPQAAQSTATVLTSPVAGASAQQGSAVVLAATVTPVGAAGTVSFRNNGTEIASAVVDAATGVASTSFDGLPVGAASLTAAFVPADSGAYASSVSGAVSYTVTPVPTPTAAVTKTTVGTPTPSTRALLGAEVSLSATVGNESGADEPVGSVEFFAAASGTTTWTSLGSAALVAGQATLRTTSLAAGGHHLRAVFTPSTADFLASEAQWVVTRGNTATVGSYGIVDLSEPAPYVPGPDAVQSTGASASWLFSAYSNSTGPAPQWVKTADGVNITVVDRAYTFENGTVTADAGGATVAFDGWFRIEPNAGYWATFTDPVLAVTADGSGVWSADVTTSVNPSPQRLVFATFSGADVDQADGHVATEIALDYVGTTAPGTWAVDASATPPVVYGSGWPNAFIWSLAPDIRAYFYQSGASAGNLTKPPSPVSVDFTWPAEPVAVVRNTGASVEQGQTLTVDARGFRAGESVNALIQSQPLALPAGTAGADGSLTFTWTVPSDFEVGDHTITLSGTQSGSVVAPFSVSAAAVVPEPGPVTIPVEEPQAATCVAQAVSGASVSWGFKQSFVNYIQTIAAGTISGGWGSGSGAFNTDADRGRVGYNGAVHYTGHSGALDITLSNLRIQVNSTSSASLILNVQSKGMAGKPDVNRSGVVFATLALPAAAESANRIAWNGAAATLTAAGAEAFAGFYSAGETLDSVSFAFPLGAEVPCDTTTDGALAATGGDAPLGAVWLGVGMLVLGAAAVAVRRRRSVRV